ncbi:uncharacterized protein LY89DRAFT_646074 [Mollisia scopiformis]|uniref:Urea active transporter n=1 Tax=Mollisia scopiformis TaxID=149040 RepID=A0A194X9Z6_MOLSC|nr:uncharacterized protein LY89DRAFT_646074 [Mollisia scopiformis]KUJ16990.1 hypothetical protein LY89DRAFT_646074 [Mollisia scopiformis]
MASTAVFEPPLSQGVAYGIALGFGVVFALTMNAITWLSRRYLHESNDTQMLMTAKKSVKTGLVASAVVSSWCYAATILNSVRLTYLYGFAGLWWFCSGATCQIVCYAIMAIELKRRAPRANTILEAIRIRFGTSSHLVFFAYGVSVQILITAALLLGGSAALNVTTGASTIAMNYLIPFGVVIYTYLGGLKSTFLSDYVHTVVIFVILLITMFKVMASSSVPILGTPGKLWDLLQPAATASPAIGAKDGSYLTMDSGEGLLLAGVILVSGFGSVFVDPSYGQKAIAGEASAVVKGYFYGAFAWFSIPLGLCATMSFVAVVLQDTEYWPASGGVTAYQINNALILPLAAQAIMGIGGVVAIILMVFMAVTSSFSAEIVAHASIVTYDIYQPYINPKATDKQLRLVSHLSLAGFAIFSSSFATALNSSGVSMGWILEFLGVVLGPAVFPITLGVTSSHVSPIFMTYAPPIGTVCALAAWLGCTKGMYGTINVTTTFENWPMFAGCLVGLMIPLLIWLAMRPFTKAYDWDLLFLMAGDRSFTLEDDESLGLDWNPQELARASFLAKTVSAVLCLIFLVLIPFPMYGTGYIMSRKFFTGWTVVVFIWSWSAALLIWCLPIWQSRAAFGRILAGMLGRKKIVSEGVETPVVEIVHGSEKY